MEIVRFFGSSGAGKETLIKKIFDNPHYHGKGIINPENNIIISNSSIDYIGEYPNDPCIKLRSNIIDEVIGCNFNDSILIKGQNIDLKNNIPNILINLKKDATHKIVFLTTTYKNLLQRCRKKSWWNSSYEIGGEQAHNERLQKEQIQKLKEIRGVSFIFVDSSNYKYKIINPLR